VNSVNVVCCDGFVAITTIIKLPGWDCTLPANEAQSCIGVVGASRRALQALLRMRSVVYGINGIPHPEEAAERPSRRTHNADPADRQFLNMPHYGSEDAGGALGGHFNLRESSRCRVAAGAAKRNRAYNIRL
jgi:hypothetical protein